MASATDIANIAITECGGEPIMDITDLTTSAELCRSRMADVIDTTLRMHTWKCAKRRFSLAASAVPPAFGATYAYPLPNDPYCLRVVEVLDDGLGWQLEGREIITDIGAPLRGWYVARIGIEDMDSLLAKVVAFNLAGAIAYRMTQSYATADKMKGYGDQLLREARSINALEGDGRDGVERATSFEDARR